MTHLPVERLRAASVAAVLDSPDVRAAYDSRRKAASTWFHGDSITKILSTPDTFVFSSAGTGRLRVGQLTIRDLTALGLPSLLTP